MMTKKAQELFKQFEAEVGSSKMDPALKDAPVVATMSGPCEVIEITVANAVKESGIIMDWGYAGGTAYIHSTGDRKKCRHALFCSILQTDLSMTDL